MAGNSTERPYDHYERISLFELMADTRERNL